MEADLPRIHLFVPTETAANHKQNGWGWNAAQQTREQHKLWLPFTVLPPGHKFWTISAHNWFVLVTPNA